MNDTVFKASQGEAFIQDKGPSPFNPLVSLGQCTDVDDIIAPQTSGEPVICRDANGNYIQVAEMTTPPGKVTSGITILSGAVRSALEKIKCSYSLYIAQGCGKKGSHTGADMYTILNRARIEQKTFSNLVKREADDPSGFGSILSAWFPVIRAVGPAGLTVERIATTCALQINDITFNRETECDAGCGTPINEGDEGAFAPNSAPAAVTGDVFFSTDEGMTWAAGAVDPFGGGFHTMTIVRVQLPDGSGERWVAGEQGLGIGQGNLAYSDDDGGAWTNVTIGGGADGWGPVKGGGMFALDFNHIWVCGWEGNIYFSGDGGVTWDIQEEGVITTAADFYQIKFWNSQIGIAGGAGGIIAGTRDGGTHWAALTPTGAGGELFSVDIFGPDKLLVGTDDGTMYYSDDFGLTWTQVTSFTGSGTGEIHGIEMVNEHVGWMVKDTAGPVGSFHRTVDGGYTWQMLTNPAVNIGLNSLHAIDENNAWAVGNLVGGLGLIYRAFEG